MALQSSRDLDHIMIASAERGRVALQRELARRLGVSDGSHARGINLRRRRHLGADPAADVGRQPSATPRQ
jgi:hypothetical protein